MAEVTEAAAEIATDVAEEVAAQAHIAADVSWRLSSRERSLIVGGVSVGLLGGAVIGFFWTRKRLETKYNQLAEDEIFEMREHFQSKLIANEQKPALAKIVEEQGYAPVPEPERPTDPRPDPATVVNVFETNVVNNVVEYEWDMTAEVASRDRNIPYVIHVDERHEEDYTESTLTYYAGDDVLCDDQDKVIDDQDLVVGVGNLDKFGHGSGDASIVYIRNDKLGIEVEVIKSDKTYAEEVHGLSHSDPPRRRRADWDD